MNNAIPQPPMPEIAAQMQAGEKLTEELHERISLLAERLSCVLLPQSPGELASSIAAPTITKMGSVLNQNNVRIESAIRKIENINSTLAL